MKLEQVIEAIQHVRLLNIQNGENIDKLKLKIIMNHSNLYSLTKEFSSDVRFIKYNPHGPVEIMEYPVTIDNALEGFEIVKVEWVGE